MFRIPRIQFTELRKVNEQKGPSEDVSIPLGEGKESNHRRQREGVRELGGKG